ncbi:MAG: hypothetical protein C0439_14195 [Pseudomonas sp.]|nr:hypothetical protein [Pseudomonas sp.]
MKGWLAVGLLSVSAAITLAVLNAPETEPVATVVPVTASATRSATHLPDPPAARTTATPAPVPAPASPPMDEPPSAPTLNVQEAQMLIQLMADDGDPRSPALGELKPRQPASPAQLADPAQYRAFEDQHSRDQIMAYASGVQQIPTIRERIEQAAQSGERSQAELDEARAALEQLEMLKSKLHREQPSGLPERGATSTAP